MTSLERDDIVVFYLLSALEIWPDKRGGLWLEWPYNTGGVGHYYVQSCVFSPCLV